MIDIYDTETLVKIYRRLNNKCNCIDNYIKNYAFGFSSGFSEFGSIDVCNSIIDLMTRKNQLINLKIILDSAVSSLDEKDRKLILLKMNYNLQVQELCKVLELKERTAFRHVERALKNLTTALNNSKYKTKLIEIMRNEIWIVNLKEDVKNRRLNYKAVATSNL